MILVLSLLASLQQQPAIDRVVVEPARAAIQIGDTLRLAARAVDASGRAVPGVTVQWFQPGGHFEGTVDSTGLVTAGATGTIVALAMVRPAGGRPATANATITVLPLPA